MSVWTTPGAEEELQIQSSWYMVAMVGGGKCKAFSVVPGQALGGWAQAMLLVVLVRAL